MIKLGFDGVNLGNTSTDYEALKEQIEDGDLKLYEFFTKQFGGGVGGHVLKSKSLHLSKIAVNELKKINTKREFHIIRTGGIENFEDIKESMDIGVSMNQWLTGFYYSFLKEGNNVYKNFFEKERVAEKL